MRIRRTLSLWGAIVVALFIPTAIAYTQSQASTGQIVGIVTDTSGAVIFKAKVTVLNSATGLKRELETNDQGQFRAWLLPPATYSVTVETQGFNTAKEPAVEVTVGSSIDLNITLQAGNVNTVVEVSAAQIEVTRSETGTTITDNFISKLPINGRRFHDFISATPTVQVEPSRNQLSFVGQRGINGNINIDGGDYNNPFFGGLRGGERANNAFTIPQESIQEFQIVAQGYSAEFGRSTGGIVNAVTKSGTNDFHGSGFFLVRNKELGSKNAFNQIAITNQFQEGASVGGPIIKDKTFFFGSFERQDINIPRQIIFSNLINAVNDPTTAEAYSHFKSLEGPYSATNDATAFLIKGDHNFNANHRLALRYNYSKNTALNAASAGTQIDPNVTNALSNNGTEGDITKTWAGQLTSIFSSNLLNEFRMQYSREDRPRIANATAATLENAIGRYGTVSFLSTTETDYRLQISNALAWNHGSHSIRIGGEFNYLDFSQFFGFDQNGAFRFTTTNPTTVLQIMSLTPGVATDHRFDNSAAFYQHALGNFLVAGATNGWAFFAQDSWRINRNFTLNYGLRWEGLWNPSPEASNTDLVNLVKGFKFPVGVSFDPTLIPDQKNQWMPRVGLAWDPKGDGKTVFRANAGIFYATTPILLLTNSLSNFRNPPGDLRIRLPLAVPTGNPNNTVYRQLLAIGINLDSFSLGNLPIVTTQQVQSIATALGITGANPLISGVGPIGHASDYENPRSFQWAGGVEHEIARGFTTGVDFFYVNTVHLQRNHDLNLPAPTLRAADGRLLYNVPSLVRPISILSSVQIRESSAHSLYRSLVFRAVFNRPKLQVKAFYTLSWNFSDDDNERDSGGSSGSDQFNFKQDYNYSNLDRRQQLSMVATYTLPYGFQVSGTSRLSSGVAFNASASSDVNGDQISTDRPYAGVGVPFKRNAFRNRPLYNVDMRIAKNFNLGSERVKLQLSADLFNIFNFNNVTYGSTNANYGLGISATGAPVPVDARFQRLRLADGTYDRNNNPGAPFQSQLGIRLIF